MGLENVYLIDLSAPTRVVTPSALYRYDPETGRSGIWHRPKPQFAARTFMQRQVFYPGRDGTRIPMLLAYRKGLVLDGRNPVLLYGYGGFGIPVLPEFSPKNIAWLELGGIYAIANIRGGGEWPELLGAAIAGVGVMDMLRFDRFGQGAGWTGEYGTPEQAADFPALYAYSPVHRVRPGTRYPATLIITGDHDTRVMPMHSYKFAATMQAAQAGPEPILLDIEKSSGHGGGPTVTQAIEQSADLFAFLVDRLDVRTAR